MSAPDDKTPLWSSKLAVYLAAAGAAVGLGSVWRFPYLAGTSGGSAFILVFVVACLLIATPQVAAELALGRRSRASPPEAAGTVAAAAGRSRGWNVIGILGTISAYILFSYYTVIAGWVLAYTWKCAAGILAAAGPRGVEPLWSRFLANPLELGAWHAAFVLLVMVISARGLQRGIEPANKVRGPALLALLCILVIYSLTTGDVRRGLTFAFKPNFASLDAQVVLAAVGQAFYATGAGQAMMLAYGAYIDRGTSVVRTSLVITASILVVSILSTLMIFPLVFGYGLNPAEGPELVFKVLARVFTEMPGGRAVGALFFLLLVLAALMPSIAALEPSVAWLIQRFRLGRAAAVTVAGGSAWVLGIASVLSFNRWSAWHPLGFLPIFAHKTVFDVFDYSTANILLPAGVFLTSIFVGWRVSDLFADEPAGTTSFARGACLWLLRIVVPIAILWIFIATLM
jgi:NSS family neurotransmitter:Na+ symporter